MLGALDLMLSSTSHTSRFRSFRASCERCRAYKLRCEPGVDGSGSCMRCRRAKRPCLFGLRGSSKPDQVATQSFQSGSDVIDAEDSAIVAPAQETNDNTLDLMMRDYSTFSDVSASPSRHPSSATTNGECFSGILFSDASQLSLSSGLDGYEMFPDHEDCQNGTCGHQGCLFWRTQQTEPQVIPTIGAGENVTNTALNATTVTSGDSSVAPPRDSLAKLLGLASDTYDYLSRIEKDGIQPSAISLKTYPIGNVLHLSHELERISRSLKKDVLAKFAMLSCYTSLIRVYSILFSELRKHALRDRPSNMNGKDSLRGAQLHEFIGPDDDEMTHLFLAVKVSMDCFRKCEQAIRHHSTGDVGTTATIGDQNGSEHSSRTRTDSSVSSMASFSPSSNCNSLGNSLGKTASSRENEQNSPQVAWLSTVTISLRMEDSDELRQDVEKLQENIQAIKDVMQRSLSY